MSSTSLPLFRFSSLADVSHGISTRHGGISPHPYATLNVGYGTDDDEDNVAGNREFLAGEMGVPESRVVAAVLTHGNDVSIFRRERPDDFPVQRLSVRQGSDRRRAFFTTDGVVSDVPGLHVLLTFADCVPLLLFDERRGVMGAAHAGWRGTAAQVGPAVVRAMCEDFGSDPSDIRAGIGPSVGPCCYSVRAEVISTFQRLGTEPSSQLRQGQTYLDLWECNRDQFRTSGVERVESAGICTACNTATYFSHRGENGVTGRFALLAGIPGAWFGEGGN